MLCLHGKASDNCMNKCILIPDSFKGTMSSLEVTDIMKRAVKKHFPECETILAPISDGGEGMVGCFLRSVKGRKVEVAAKGPFMEDISATYGIAGDAAFIELAETAGLTLAKNGLDPSKTTTYGVGMLISDAVKKGCKKIILGLGGSCTNDGAAGMAAAVGVKFFNRQGKEFLPRGDTLSLVERIDVHECEQRLRNITVTALCDINNPMYGPNGAAYVFAPQKGANPKMVKVLDNELKSFSSTITKNLGVDVSNIKGSGAACAAGAGVCALLNGELRSGIDAMLEIIDFDKLLDNCDCVFTGEGRLDSQSLSGKVVVGVSRRALKRNTPTIAVVGSIVGNEIEFKEEGITRIVETSKNRISEDEIAEHCRADLYKAMENVLEELKESRTN